MAIHKVAEDLKIPVKDSIAMDDPAKYSYKVQILEEERQPGFGKPDKSKGKETNRGQWGGQLMDVDCSKMRFVPRRNAWTSSYSYCLLVAIALLSPSPSYGVSSEIVWTGMPQSLHHGR